MNKHKAGFGSKQTDAVLETAFLDRVQTALTGAGFWKEFATDWVALDAELMPWSVKAQALLRHQYARVGAAAHSALAVAVAALAEATVTQPDLMPVLAAYETRAQLADQYVAAYRHYCWPVERVTDLKLAPFHLLATAGAVHTDKDHGWHMSTLARLCAADPAMLLPTTTQVVDCAIRPTRLPPSPGGRR